MLAFGVQDDVNVTEKLQETGMLHIPRSPTTNCTRRFSVFLTLKDTSFLQSLRNPMLPSTLAVSSTSSSVLAPNTLITNLLNQNIYRVFYPNATDPIRKGNGTIFPPLGKNPFNPWEGTKISFLTFLFFLFLIFFVVNYQCWRVTTKPKFVPVSLPTLAPKTL